jgi:rhamnosyltransferase subunit B
MARGKRLYNERYGSNKNREQQPAMKRILLAAIGSLGDIHPMIAIGLALQSRGYEIVFATSSYYHKRLEQFGFTVRTLRPDSINPTDTDMLASLMDLRLGTGRLMRDYIFANIKDTYDDLFDFSEDVDAILVTELVYAGRLVAEVRGIPWAFLALSPGTFFSVHDMPVLPGAEGFSFLTKFGPLVNEALIGLGKLSCVTWPAPYHSLRRSLGLPPQDNPIFKAKFSPHLVLAAFSSVLGRPQPDWPASAVLSGFAYHYSVPDLFDLDKQANNNKLAKFLESGEPPIIFTLGSAAMFVPGDFYHESLEAARRLNRRAIFLMGQNALFEDLPDTMLAVDYLPFQDVFPHAAAIVHQGGVGTSAQALRAGKPTLCVPFSHDQPDNAARLERLGASLSLPRKKYRAAAVADRLSKLLDGQANSHVVRAAEVAALIRADDRERDGAERAADSILQMITDG